MKKNECIRSKENIMKVTIILFIFFSIVNNIIANGSEYNRSSHSLTKELKVNQELEGDLLDLRMSVKRNISDRNRILFRGPNGDVIVMQRHKVNNLIDKIILIAELTGLENSIIRALPIEYQAIINVAKYMRVKIDKFAHDQIWKKISSTQTALRRVEGKRIRVINDFLRVVRSRVKKILVERKKLRIYEDQPRINIKGLWRTKSKIEVRYRDNFDGYYVKVQGLKRYNFKRGDLGYQIKKRIGPNKYKLSVKWCWTDKARPCYWKHNYTLTILDRNTMKVSDRSSETIWYRVRY